MHRFLLNILLTFCSFCLLNSCGEADEPAPPAPPSPSEEVHRTVLVYMLADNNLGWANSFDAYDLDEMVRGAKTAA